MNVQAVGVGNKTVNMELDQVLLAAVITLLLIGLVMVTSASVAVAEAQTENALYYLWKHGSYLLLGLILGFSVLRIPVSWWYRQSWVLLAIALMLLMVVLLPGIGRTVNGSTRWISLGVVNLQASEVAKLCIVVYTAGYLVRRLVEVRESWWGFMKPILVLMLTAFLLLMEPDFGALVVMMGAVVGMIFLSGVALRYFLTLVTLCGASIALLAVSQPYRLKRLTAYTDPWADQFDTGYQLTQALIAFGRGEWFGVGLGNSVQKLFYLPEAHTDFVFAILAEEFGLIGVLFVIGLYLLLFYRGMLIGRQAEMKNRLFHAYLAYGICLLLAIQTFINLGVNSGLLPTKGLTLPLVSYGGSSLLVSCISVALLLRIGSEVAQAAAPEKGAVNSPDFRKVAL